MNEWKDTKSENPNFTCPRCLSNNVKYKLVEDFAGHEDYRYHCDNCNRDWTVDGADY
jgi:transposase-like protein